MANSDRKINRGVRVKRKTYVPGQEDELDALLSSQEVKRLSDKGHIEGRWSGGASKSEPEDGAKESTQEKKPAAATKSAKDKE